MSYIERLSHLSVSGLEKHFQEITRLQQELLSIQFELAETKAELKAALELALFEDKVYSGIKRFFK
jgi:hypothetical protein